MRKTVFVVLLFPMVAIPLHAQLSSPNIVSPKGDNRVGTTPTLHWQQLDDATWYRIWINNKTKGTNHLKKWIKGSNSWTIPENSALNPDDTYRWWVAGWNSTDKRGNWSSAAVFRAGKVHYEAVLASDFKRDNTESTTSTAIFDDGLVLKHNGTDPEEKFVASVDIPDGARILEIKAFWNDNDPGGNVRMAFGQGSYHSDGFVVAEFSSEGHAGTDETTTVDSIDPSVVDKKNTIYGVTFDFPHTGNDRVIKFYSMRIKYIR